MEGGDISVMLNCHLFDNQECDDAREEAETLFQIFGVVVAVGVAAPMAVAVTVVVMPMSMILKGCGG